MEDEDEGIDCSPCCRNKRFRETFISVCLGQLLSLCLCVTAVTSQLLTDKYQANTPTAQAFGNYFFLCLIYGTMLSCRSPYESNLISVIWLRGWKYLVLAFIDVEANYLVVRAYQYTNLTSIQILDCFTIPIVLILSFVFLSVRYLLSHIIGVGICLVGIGCLIWGDVVFRNGASGGENKLLGDILCLCGAALYGVGNVGEEYLVKSHARLEYLGMIGLFGSIISGIQLSIFERENLSRVPWHRYEVVLLYLGFAASMFTFYSLVAVVMQRTSATLFNLSILTADFFALIVGKLVFGYTFHALYLLSFALVLAGSIIYSVRPTHKRQTDAAQTSLSRTNYSEIPPIVLDSTAATADGGVNSTFLTDPNVTVKYCPVHGTVMVPRAPAISNVSTITNSLVDTNSPVSLPTVRDQQQRKSIAVNRA